MSKVFCCRFKYILFFFTLVNSRVYARYFPEYEFINRSLLLFTTDNVNTFDTSADRQWKTHEHAVTFFMCLRPVFVKEKLLLLLITCRRNYTSRDTRLGCVVSTAITMLRMENRVETTITMNPKFHDFFKETKSVHSAFVSSPTPTATC